MARYCANEGCVRFDHPLPDDGRPCPECGSIEYRLDPDVGTVRCPECEAPNEATADACWDCDAVLGHRLVE